MVCFKLLLIILVVISVLELTPTAAEYYSRRGVSYNAHKTGYSSRAGGYGRSYTGYRGNGYGSRSLYGASYKTSKYGSGSKFIPEGNIGTNALLLKKLKSHAKDVLNYNHQKAKVYHKAASAVLGYQHALQALAHGGGYGRHPTGAYVGHHGFYGSRTRGYRGYLDSHNYDGHHASYGSHGYHF